MKRGIFLFVLVILSGLVLVGCKETEKKVSLATPTNLVVEHQQIVFDQVENATCYLINYDGMTFYAFPSSDGKMVIDVSNVFTEAKNYQVKVKAIGKGKYLDSNYTATFVYERANSFNAPNIYLNNRTLTWDKIDNATNYTVKVSLPDGSTYTYNAGINYSDITPILNQVGTYYFQVKVGEKTDDNEYSVAESYTFSKQLATPTDLDLAYDDEELYLTFTTDENSYGYKLFVNGNEYKLYDLNLKSYTVDTGYDNLVRIKLLSFLSSQNTNYNDKNFSISLQAVASQNSNFYDSEKSASVECAIKTQLEAPTLSVEKDGDKVGISWSKVEGATSYALYQDYEFYLELKKEGSLWFNASDVEGKVFTIQAVGVGDKVSSVMSEPVASTNIGAVSQNSLAFSNGVISWNAIASATRYVLEVSNDSVYKRYVLEGETVLNMSNEFDYADYTVVLSSIADGKMPNRISRTISYGKTLSVVKNAKVTSAGANFTLSFDKVSGAIGYAIKLNGEDVKELFLSNVIDITSHLMATSLDKYTIEVMAVAEYNKNIKSSAWLTVDNIALTEKLAQPDFKVLNENGVDVISTGDKGEYKEYKLHITPVKNAQSYTISINYVTVYENVSYKEDGYSISSYLSSAQKYTIRVKANAGTDANYTDSDYNTKYLSRYIQLETINDSDMTIDLVDDKYWLSFSSQTLATSYKVRINYGDKDEYITRNSTTIDISEYVQASGVYKIYVTAEALNGENYFYISSSESTNPYILRKELTSLDAVANISVEERVAGHSQVVASWNKVANADQYYINVYYTPTHEQNPETKLISELTSSTNSFNFGAFLTLEGKYEIKIKALANGYESTSFTSFTYEYTMMVDSDYERNVVYIDGESYNHLVKSYEQYEKLLWYYYIYNNNVYYDNASNSNYVMKVMFDIGLDGDDGLISQFNSKYNLAIDFGGVLDNMYYITYMALNSYYEQTYLSIFNSATTDSDVDNAKQYVEIENIALNEQNYFIINFKAMYSDDKTAVLSQAQEYEKYNAFMSLLHSSEMRATADNYLNYVYEIDKLEKVDVTTTEQLFIAVQSGKAPNFVGDSDVAQTVYKNAKKVLNTIISYDMTDYEKVVAIYDWLIKNVEYNYDFEEKSMLVSDFNQALVANGPAVAEYKYNYLEGVFYDENNRSAVANGYAKAFVLMCRIEGVEAIKINGTKTVGGKKHNYFWNKVNIDITPNNADNTKSWTLVDVGASYSQVEFNRGYYQLPTHNYFMISDEKYSSKMDNVVYSASKNNASFAGYRAVNGNYFDNTSYSYEFSQVRYDSETGTVITDVYQGFGKFSYTSTDSMTAENYIKDVLTFLASEFNKKNNCMVDVRFDEKAVAEVLASNIGGYCNDLMEKLGSSEWSWAYMVQTNGNVMTIAFMPN